MISMTRKHLATALATGLILAVPAMANAATATAADKAFVAKVSQGGMLEVEAGKLAEKQGNAQDVRDFGAMEDHDHTLVNKKLKSIAGAEGITVPSNLDETHQKDLDHLKTLKGKSFDQAYMSEMATLHDGDGAAFSKEGKEGGSKAFRDFGQESAIIVQRHLGAIHAAAPPAKS